MGLLRGVARTAVVAGTASAVGGRVRHRQDQKWAAQDAQSGAYDAPPPIPAQQAAPPAPDPAPDMLAQLKTLGELKSQGVLTQEEFDREKAKILAR